MKDKTYHRQSGHERLTCDACHTAWAPQCYGCHISYDPNQSQYDHLEKKKTPGCWIEKRWKTESHLPTLGVTGENRITTFIPGMNMTIEKPGETAPIVKRLYSSISAHTTQKKGRSCKSCHNSDQVLGIIKEWAIAPQNNQWKTPVGCIEKDQRNPGAATQEGARSFNQTEIGRIKKVGACLSCHAETVSIFHNFSQSLHNKKFVCQ